MTSWQNLECRDRRCSGIAEKALARLGSAFPAGPCVTGGRTWIYGLKRGVLLSPSPKTTKPPRWSANGFEKLGDPDSDFTIFDFRRPAGQLQSPSDQR